MNSHHESPQFENPFIPDRPVSQGFSLIGREDTIVRIREVLGDAPVENPLVLSGPPGIGKTSLLLALADGALETDTAVLYTDFSEIDSSSESIFLWQVAKSIMHAMEQQELAGPIIEKRMLVLNPQLVFRQRFWNALLNRAQTTPMLFVWDNFDSLASTSTESRNSQTLRAYLYGLLETDAPADLLLTVTGRLEALGENTLAPYRPKRSIRLTNLDAEQTSRLIQYLDRLPVVDSVANFMFYLTGGHPGDTQRLCHTLYQRHVARNHGQVTIADVIAVLEEKLAPSDFVGDVYRRLNKTVVMNFGTTESGRLP